MKFVKRKYSPAYYDYEEMQFPKIYNLKETADFIAAHVNSQTNVTVVGDYDCDGICSTAIMYWTLKQLQCTRWARGSRACPANGGSRGGSRERLTLRLPHRFSEGYGLSEKIIDEIPDGLLITIDNGIASTKSIRKAKEKGLTVVVIDHHLPATSNTGQVILPEADMILDPHAETSVADSQKSEFVDYCGAGLAYRLARELFPDKKMKPLLVLASIGTVTDVMPLVGANRTLVRDGLAAINKRNVVPGLGVLLDKLKLDTHITEEDYGFKIGPVFNAAGRMKDDGAGDALKLMCSERGDVRAPYMADRLIQTNEQRKEEMKAEMKIAHKKMDGSRPVVLYDPSFYEGIVGILAGKISEELNCPAIVFADGENGTLKGSGRSPEGVNLKETLDQIQDLIMNYGGHAGAAGLTIQKNELERFTEAFRATVPDLSPVEPEIIYYDEELDPRSLDKTVEELRSLAPFGEGNPKPVFHLYHHGGKATRIGDGSHFQIRDKSLTLVGFGLADEYFKTLGNPDTFECVGTLAEDWFRGKRSYKFQILAMKA